MVKILLKSFCILKIIILIGGSSYAQSISFPSSITTDHPRLLTPKNGQANLQQKLAASSWANANYLAAKSAVDVYVNRHVTDPEWITSRLIMYWNKKHTKEFIQNDEFVRSEGPAALVPTVHYAGERDWNTIYATPSINDIQPYMGDSTHIYLYNKTAESWQWAPVKSTGHVIETINERTMALAADAAMIYWFTGEEKYAKFAKDIFKLYMQGMYYKQDPTDLGGSANLKNKGLATFEIIHDNIINHVAITYDFLHDYLAANAASGEMEIYTGMIKRWADWGVNHGNNDGNWNIIQASLITYLALCLENDNTYADLKGWKYYLDRVYNINTSNTQTALINAISQFDPVTGFWDEAPGYSLFVPELILQCIKLTDNVLNNNLLGQFPIIKKSVLNSAQYLLQNKLSPAFGDTNNSPLSASSMENIISISQKNNFLADEQQFTGLYKMAFGNSRSISRNPYTLFTYVGDFLKTGVSTDMKDYTTGTFFADNVNWLIQRNGYDKVNGMAVSTNGGFGGHATPNGLNMELYAKGFTLAPDPGTGSSYWSSDYGEYYSKYPAHNTVIVNGKSDSKREFTLLSVYPNLEQKTGYYADITYLHANYVETKESATQQRINGTVRTSPTTGYFVDIFRSKKTAGSGDVKHEYFYHNMGQSLTLKNASNTPLTLASTTQLSSSSGDVSGYNYFTAKKTVVHTGDFNAEFNLIYPGKSDTRMNVWMKGYPDRQLFSVMAPKSNSFDNLYTTEIKDLLIPTLIVRQTGEAWNRPFAAILEPYTVDENRSITASSSFNPVGAPEDFVGLNVTSGTLSNDFIFSATSSTTLVTHNSMTFKGTYGIIADKPDNGLLLFLGNGLELGKDAYKLNSEIATNAVLSKTGTELFLSSNGFIKLTLPDSYATGYVILKHANNSTQFTGVRTTLNGNNVVQFDLPAINYGKVTITLSANPVTAAKNIPGVIETEDFNTGGQGVAYFDNDTANQGGKYRAEGVDIQAATEGGYNLGWTAVNEWLKYDVNVTSAGQYQMVARVATTNTSAKFRVEFGATNVSGTVTIPNTGGTQVFKDVIKTVTLSAGVQTMRLFIEGGTPNVNKITFVPLTTSPVVIGTYTARADGYRSVIHWTTSSEQNNSRFEVERSVDGVNFNTILGTINAKGSISAGGDYTLYDVEPENGTTYYRLVQYDTNGNRTEYAIKALTFSPTANPDLGKQTIGKFPLMNGGFEGATAGTGTNNIPQGAPVWFGAGASGTNDLSTSGGRSGPSKFIISNTVTTSNTNPRQFISPGMSSGTMLPNTPYVMVFWYKAANNTSFPTNYLVVGASTSSGVNPTYPVSSQNITNYGTNYSGWTKKVITITTPTAAVQAPGVGFASFKMGSNTTSLKEKVDVDDFVMYPGTTEDNVAPGTPLLPTVATNGNSEELDVSWTAPNAAPADLTGYIVTRYNTNPTASDNPNQKGIYALYNQVKGTNPNTGKVVYIGTSTSFTDNYDLVDGGNYYYKIYAVDHAFNYSIAASANNIAQTLPVSLISYTAGADGEKVKLQWKTQSEQNNKEFQIEKAGSDGIFRKMGMPVQGNGTTSQTHAYTTYDYQPLNGDNYYKLIQYDFDGKSEEKGIRVVNFKLNKSSTVTVYPNPVSDVIYFSLTGYAASAITAKLISLDGRTIYKENYQHQNENTNYQLHLKEKPSSGIYLLQLQGEGLSQNIKLLIK